MAASPAMVRNETTSAMYSRTTIFWLPIVNVVGASFSSDNVLLLTRSVSSLIWSSDFACPEELIPCSRIHFLVSSFTLRKTSSQRFWFAGDSSACSVALGGADTSITGVGGVTEVAGVAEVAGVIEASGVSRAYGAAGATRVTDGALIAEIEYDASVAEGWEGDNGREFEDVDGREADN